MANVTKQTFLQRFKDFSSKAVYKAQVKTGNLEEPVIPEEGNANIGVAVNALFEESRAYFEADLLRWKDDRFPYTNVEEWYKNMAKMENGDHWGVYGHRNKDSNDLWKQELVDDEIGKQIRIRSTNINAGWHDIVINPNVENLNEIFDQERVTTDWAQRVRKYQKAASIYGRSWLKTVLDVSRNPLGVIREEYCRTGTIFKTPYSSGIEKSDGCWYVIEAAMITDKQVQEVYPDFDLEGVEVARFDKLKKYFQDKVTEVKPLNYTSIYDKLEIWCDDNTQIVTPYADAETMIEHATSAQGGEISAHRTDNHQKHIEAHKAFIEGIKSAVPADEMTAEDQDLIAKQEELMNHHIGDHEKLQERDKKRGLKAGHTWKYPYGRKIVTIGGKVAEDVQNPFGMDRLGWRDLWHPLKNEDVPERDDGRGDVEILFNTNKVMDIAVSRIGDASLSYALPKAWFNILDKKDVLADYNNDPNTPGFYRTAAPVWRQANSPKEFFELLNYFKANAQDRLGVTKTIQGKAPTQSSSNKLAETLLRQSETLVMGELDLNLNDAIRKIVKTRIMLYKKFYVEPRFWFINGVPKAINLSRALSYMTVEDAETGQEKEVEIPDFEITVRPGSNLPNQWENQVEILSSLITEVGAMDPAFAQGATRMLEDVIAQRFPQLGPNGSYYKLGEKMARAMQIVEQQDAQAEAEQKDREALAGKVKSKVTTSLLKGEPLFTGPKNQKNGGAGE